MRVCVCVCFPEWPGRSTQSVYDERMWMPLNYWFSRDKPHGLSLECMGKRTHSGAHIHTHTDTHTHTHCHGEAGQRSTCTTFRNPCHPDQSGREFLLWEVNIFLNLTVWGRKSFMAATDTSIRLRGAREAGLRAENCVERWGDHRLEESGWPGFKSTILTLGKPLLHLGASVSPAVKWIS